MRTMKQADIASDNHELVVFKMELKLNKHWTTGETSLRNFNANFPRDTDKLYEFKITVNNRFQALQDLLQEEETTMKNNLK
ncbi:unnamed protein product [Schistosoma curassoni]|uniref:COMM domain-containing protein n=1 Tax=Schistosoma curassoni TaxID=6186 RepID=A0A183JJB0_9TREM|nr:unnamed protein product [Schistosoma curassoni]